MKKKKQLLVVDIGAEDDDQMFAYLLPDKYTEKMEDLVGNEEFDEINDLCNKHGKKIDIDFWFRRG